MAKKSTKHTKLPKGHPAFNLPDPQGGNFEGAQLNSPGPMSPPGMPQRMAAMAMATQGEE
jgi:hypothetical protein